MENLCGSREKSKLPIPVLPRSQAGSGRCSQSQMVPDNSLHPSRLCTAGTGRGRWRLGLQGGGRRKRRPVFLECGACLTLYPFAAGAVDVPVKTTGAEWHQDFLWEGGRRERGQGGSSSDLSGCHGCQRNQGSRGPPCAGRGSVGLLRARPGIRRAICGAWCPFPPRTRHLGAAGPSWRRGGRAVGRPWRRARLCWPVHVTGTPPAGQLPPAQPRGGQRGSQCHSF